MISALQRRNIVIAIKNESGDEIADMIDVIEDAGVIVNATLVMSAQPVATNTVPIGADLYEFQAGGADLADDANIAVEIGASPAETRDNLVAAVNASTQGNEHATIFQTDSTTPALANGTEPVVALATGTDMIIFGNDAFPGNPAAPSNPDILLGENITDAADIWEEGNVNLNTLGGAPSVSRQEANGELTITAAMITKGSKFIALGFAPTNIQVQVFDSTNAVRSSGTDVHAISGNGFTITFGAGVDPDIQATDKVRFRALS